MLDPAYKGLWNYEQPEFYRFNSDSIQLSQQAFQSSIQVKDSSLKKMRILDLGAGSGVVGLEFLAQFSSSIEIDLFLWELQPDFSPALQKNIDAFHDLNPNFKGKIEYKIVDILTAKENKFDLILCNPPYYKSNGQLSKDRRRGLCRQEIKLSCHHLPRLCLTFLKKKGEAFFLWPKENSINSWGDNHLQYVQLAELKNVFIARAMHLNIN